MVVWAGVEAGVEAGVAAGVAAVAIVHHLAVAIVRPEVEAVAIVHHHLLVEGDNLWEILLPFLESLRAKSHLLVEGGIVHQLHPMAIGRRTDTKLNF